MRQAQHGRKLRGRGRKPNNPMSRTFDSVGPETKVRGTAAHIADRYVTLAREAQLSGDRVIAENYLQHAEHYIRIVAAAQEQALAAQQATQAQQASSHQSGQPQNGQRAPGRPFPDEAAPANDRARGDDQANGAGDASARGNENSGRRGGRRREPAPNAGYAPADKSAQSSATEAELQGLPPSAIQPEAVNPPEGVAPLETEIPQEADIPQEVEEVEEVEAAVEAAAPAAKVSDEAENEPAKPAPKRRRRTKATTENTGDPVV